MKTLLRRLYLDNRSLVFLSVDVKEIEDLERVHMAYEIYEMSYRI